MRPSRAARFAAVLLLAFAGTAFAANEPTADWNPDPDPSSPEGVDNPGAVASADGTAEITITTGTASLTGTPTGGLVSAGSVALITCSVSQLSGPAGTLQIVGPIGFSMARLSDTSWSPPGTITLGCVATTQPVTGLLTCDQTPKFPPGRTIKTWWDVSCPAATAPEWSSTPNNGVAINLAAAQEQTRSVLRLLEGHLATRTWLELERPTVADLACFPYVGLAPERDRQRAEEGHAHATHPQPAAQRRGSARLEPPHQVAHLHVHAFEVAAAVQAHAHPQAMQRLGLGWEWFLPRKPSLVYCSISAFGQDGPRGCDFNMRWLAAAVGDLQRILRRGGMFFYVADRRPGYERGRLRLVYEANPIAFLCEQAGGAATDGTRRILDIVPEALHQHTPLVFGSAEEGFLLTPDRLCWKNIAEEAKQLPWALLEADKVEASGGYVKVLGGWLQLTGRRELLEPVAALLRALGEEAKRLSEGG
mgnify:CR=1 FL=1